MKTIKDKIYDYIQKKLISGTEKNVTTQQIANEMSLQRSYVSAALNELTVENKLVKSDGRPVRYSLSSEQKIINGDAILNDLIGYDGSLKQVIKLAKAGVLYSQEKLNMLISAKKGSGTSFFVKTFCKYAVAQGVIESEESYIRINCRHYIDNENDLDNILFGNEVLDIKSVFDNHGCIVFIDGAEELTASQSSKLLKLLENETDGNAKDKNNIILILSCTPSVAEKFSGFVPITLEMPDYNDRSLKEKIAFIDTFFQQESVNSHTNIRVDIQAIKALAITTFPRDIKGLKSEIKIDCAGAFLRTVNRKNPDIVITIDDLSERVKYSISAIKNYENDFISILGIKNFCYYNQRVQIDDSKPNVDYYNEIKKQYQSLVELGVNDSSISSIMASYIGSLFERYNLDLHSSNKVSYLDKVVDSKIISIIDAFLFEKDIKLRPDSYCGLCLHINALINISSSSENSMSEEQIKEFISVYPDQYALAAILAKRLCETYGIELSIRDIILLAMFFVEKDNRDKIHPSLLYIMHGESSASSLMRVTNDLTKLNNAYGYDIKLEEDIETSRKEITEIIKNINKGCGVFVIYDMGSIKTILDSISEETGIRINCIQQPITLVGIDLAHKCANASDIDDIDSDIYDNYFKQLQTNNKPKAIITLCYTGEGGAIELKNYIDQYSKLNFEIIPLSVASRTELRDTVRDLQKAYRIHSFVGTFDPKILSIPYIPIRKIFQGNQQDLDKILMFEPAKSRNVDYDTIYESLQNRFKYASIAKLKMIMPEIIDDFSRYYSLDIDKEIGLFIHTVSLVENLLEGNKRDLLIDWQKINESFPEDYNTIYRILKKLENAFRIIISDGEISIFIMMLKEIN